MTKPALVVIDAAKVLSSAVREIFDHPIVQRCQAHKVRSVESHLPESLGNTVASKGRALGAPVCPRRLVCCQTEALSFPR